jgi:hypothetical protein
MTASIDFANWLSNAWEVLLLYIIPVGGGIPAGVLLAQSKGIPWPASAALYFVSDVMLALVFEPALYLFKRLKIFSKFTEAFKKSQQITIAKFGAKPKPLTLIMISFGVDPMTGRTAALMAGHGFISGWTVAIIGDMIFFGIVMVSTIYLNKLLGDGTWTAIIITVLVLGVPALIRRLRERRKALKPS